MVCHSRRIRFPAFTLMLLVGIGCGSSNEPDSIQQTHPADEGSKTPEKTPPAKQKSPPRDISIAKLVLPPRPKNHPHIGRKSKDGKITIGLETTWLLEPLDKRGYVDYAEALNQMLGKGATPENNGAVLYWQAMGPAEIPVSLRAELFRRLGIKPLPEKGDYFRPVKPNDDFADDRQTCASRPWQRSEFPKVAAWLDGNDAALKTIAAAVRRPAFYSPLLSEERFGERHRAWTLALPAALTSRHAARALAARAMLHIGEKRRQAARIDLLTMHRLARQIARPPVAITTLVGIAVDGVSFPADHALAHSGLLSAKQAAEHRKELRRLGHIRDVGQALSVGERCLTIDSFTLMARDGIRGWKANIAGASSRRNDVSPKDAQFAKALALFEWDRILQRVNAKFDEIQRIAKIENRNERLRTVRNFHAEVRAKAGQFGTAGDAGIPAEKFRGDRTSQMMLAFLLPAAGEALEARDRAKMTFELTQLALALAAYYADGQRYPDQLESLVPNYIEAVPLDRYSNRPLKYSTSGNGYLLYSIGRNGKDDGGIDRRIKFSSDDIVVRKR